MKVFYISPINQKSPLLFDTLPFDKTEDIDDSTVIFFDFHSGLFDYDWLIIDKVIEKKLPVVIFDQFDYYTGGGFRNTLFEKYASEQDRDWAKAFTAFNDNELVKVYFMRKMSKTIKYPSYFYPYEIIQYPDHIFPPVSMEELFLRPNDICFIGNSATPRNSICNELQKHFICDFRLGKERLPHEEWLSRHRNAKLFVECGGGGKSGGGFNSERSYQLITISPMLKVIDEQFILHEWTNGINCLKVSEQPTEGEINFIMAVLNDNEKLYEIYTNGIAYMKQYYNAEARALHILRILKENGIC